MSLSEQIKIILEGLKNSSNIPVEDEPIIIARFGRKFEQSFLGYTLPDDANLFYGQEEYSFFSDSLQEMMNTQPEGYDPSNPTGGCNAQFFESVKHLMVVGGDELKYFISVGTKMDFWHGADAVFFWRDVVVTVDVTVDPEKDYKADFIVFPHDVESGAVYNKIAQRIVALLISRYLDKFDPDRVKCYL